MPRPKGKEKRKETKQQLPMGTKQEEMGGRASAPLPHAVLRFAPPTGRDSRLPAQRPSTEGAAFSGAPARPAQDRIRVGARGLELDSCRGSACSPPTRRSKALPRRTQVPGPTLRFSLGRDRQAELSLRLASFESSLVKVQ